MNSEVVVKYFDHQGVSGHDNEIQWFKGQCHCQNCKPSWDVFITHYNDTDNPSYSRAIGILYPVQQSSSMRCFQKSLDPSRAKHLLNESKIRLELLTYQILRQQFGFNI